MSRSVAFLRSTAVLTVFLPFALLTAACSDDASTGGAGGAGGTGVTTSSGTPGSGGNSGSTGNGGSGGPAGAPDTPPPAVVSTFPASDAKSVAVSGPITATFTEAMAPSTITAMTFRLRLGAVD